MIIDAKKIIIETKIEYHKIDPLLVEIVNNTIIYHKIFYIIISVKIVTSITIRPLTLPIIRLLLINSNHNLIEVNIQIHINIKLILLLFNKTINKNNLNKIIILTYQKLLLIRIRKYCLMKNLPIIE